MTFNVQNLFDNVDDAGKDDKAYLPIGAKQNDAHIRECNEIEVASWRDECLPAKASWRAPTAAWYAVRNKKILITH